MIADSRWYFKDPKEVMMLDSERRQLLELESLSRVYDSFRNSNFQVMTLNSNWRQPIKLSSNINDFRNFPVTLKADHYQLWVIMMLISIVWAIMMLLF